MAIEIRVKSLPRFLRYQPFVDERELRLLEHVRDSYNPQRIYYPGSGIDQIPRKVFGQDLCTYSSLNDAKFYFRRNPPDIVADFKSNPFPDGCFDFVYIHYPPHEELMLGAADLVRVLTPRGLLLVCGEDTLDEHESLVGQFRTQATFQEITPESFQGAKYKMYTRPYRDDQRRLTTRKKYEELLLKGEDAWVNGHSLTLLQRS